MARDVKETAARSSDWFARVREDAERILRLVNLAAENGREDGFTIAELKNAVRTSQAGMSRERVYGALALLHEQGLVEAQGSNLARFVQGHGAIEVSEVVETLEGVFGPKLTAVIARVDDPAVVDEWRSNVHQPPPEVEARLRAAFETTELLLTVESEQGVRSWFMGMNPYLHDRSPALVISEDPVSVRKAALALIAHG